MKYRVASGGHYIPEDVVRRRYKPSLLNFLDLYIPVFDYWIAVDNSDETYSLIAEGTVKGENKIYDSTMWGDLL